MIYLKPQTSANVQSPSRKFTRCALRSNNATPIIKSSTIRLVRLNARDGQHKGTRSADAEEEANTGLLRVCQRDWKRPPTSRGSDQELRIPWRGSYVIT